MHIYAFVSQEVLRQKLEDGFVSLLVAGSMKGAAAATGTGFSGGYTCGEVLDKHGMYI
jgi:hypothetical protein